MANSPLSQETDLVSYSIMVDGQELSSTAVVHTVEVRKEVNKIPTATLVVLDGDPASLSFPLSEGNTFKPGNKVKISAGYHQKEEAIFEGVIVSHGMRINEEGFSELSVRCVDAAASMTVQKKNKYSSPHSIK